MSAYATFRITSMSSAYLVLFLEQAGIVIAQEAGGFVTGSKDSLHDGDVTEAILTGRKYLVVRGITDSEVCLSVNILFVGLTLCRARKQSTRRKESSRNSTKR